MPIATKQIGHYDTPSCCFWSVTSFLSPFFSVLLQAKPFLKGTSCVAMPAWQRCYGGMATLLRRRGNVVAAAWQRCYGVVATCYTVCRHRYSLLRNGFMGDKNGESEWEKRVFHLCSMCVVFVQVLCRNVCTPFLINSAIFIKKNPLFSGNVVYEKSGGGVVKSGR